MATETDYLKLYKKDPVADRNDTFNIKTMLNDNWDKLDAVLFNLNKDKVDKITGKGLSKNDYSDLEKQKVEDNKTNLESHLADITNQEGRHGIRYFDERLEVEENGKWELIKSNKPDPTTWKGVQDIVRKGLANEFFSVGDQIASGYDGGEVIWEVIGIDVDTPTASGLTHSMTIQTQECLHDIQFDAPEPSNPDSNRKQYGNNRYIYSAIRQWLNSNENSFLWKSQHQYDTKPTDSLPIYNGPGFLNKLDPELVAVLGAVNKRVARNTAVDGGGQDTFSDKVFLPSRVEVGLGTEGSTTGEVVYPYYDGIADSGRIKQLNGSNRFWWLRSPFVSNSSYVRYVNTSGAVISNYAYNANGVSPACVII